MELSLITKPTLILDPQRCQKNILRMIAKARNQNIILRPHFKTHQSLEIGHWFSDQGIDKMTVSSVGMANYFAKAGWKDITIAFPVNIRQLEEIKSLSAQLKLGLLVVDAETVDVLGKQLKSPVSIWIKVDVGTHRTGLGPEQTALADQIVERINQFPQLHFAGFLAHAGHTYQSRTQAEVQHIYDSSLAIMINLKNRYLSTFPEL
jgi:D-serine deaminase-like pyridoxal phosphate-dependent protein